MSKTQQKITGHAKTQEDGARPPEERKPREPDPKMTLMVGLQMGILEGR